MSLCINVGANAVNTERSFGKKQNKLLASFTAAWKIDVHDPTCHCGLKRHLLRAFEKETCIMHWLLAKATTNTPEEMNMYMGEFRTTPS